MEYKILKEAILRVLQVYETEISMESTFELDLGADSIDMMQIMQYIEKKTEKKFRAVDLDKIVTVADAVRVMQEQMM
ncbi:MAG: acyl carrier protein [Lachnospiraceae bacterium]|nr:acyl carrier protein [Lachnospiraceae bacterium]